VSTHHDDHAPHGDADQGEHHGFIGHEVDQVESGRMFILLAMLSVVTLGSAIGLVQVFRAQTDAITESRYEQGSWRLAQYKSEMGAAAGGYGRSTEEGKDFWTIPQAKAAELVLADPSRLLPREAPADFVHPDDQGGGSAPAGMPAPAAPAAPAAPTAPAEGTPVDAAPAGDGAAAGAGEAGAAAAPAAPTDAAAPPAVPSGDAPAAAAPAAAPEGAG
jgi:hypothetical protein